MSVFDKILQKKYSRMPKDPMLDLEESEETEPATIENSVIKAKNQPPAAPKLPDYKKLAEAKPAAPKTVDKQLKDEEKAAKAIEKDADVGSSVDALVGGANPSQATPGYGPVAYKPYKFEKTDFGQSLRSELKEIAVKYDKQLNAISNDATRKESRIQMKKVLKDLVDAAALLYLANNSPEAQIKTGGQSEEMQAELSRLDNLVKQRQSIVKDQFRELRDAIKSQYAQKEKDELAKLGIENKNIDLENQALAQRRSENIAESRYQRKLGADIADREDRQRHAREMLELSQAGKKAATMLKPGGGVGKPLSPPELKTIKDYDIILSDVKNLKELKKQVDTGPISGRQFAVAQRFGVEDPTKKQLNMALIDTLANKIKSLSGAAASDKEREFLSQSLPKMTDNDEQFDAAVNYVEDRLRRLQQQEINTFAESGRDVSGFQKREAGLVRMIAPNGREFMVPADKVSEAEARGGRRK